MSRITVLFCAVLCMEMLFSCSSGKKTAINEMATYTTFETKCLGVDLDGNQMLRVWGKGRNKSEAVEAAKKQALEEVIFKGITLGSSGYAVRPLVLDVNAQEKYEDYFNKFFSKKKNYKKYVKQAEKDYTEASTKYQTNVAIVVIVKRNELKQRLVDDKIIEP